MMRNGEKSQKLTFNQVVVGSSPARLTNSIKELANIELTPFSLCRRWVDGRNLFGEAEEFRPGAPGEIERKRK
jgi:hypothetical protein